MRKDDIDTARALQARWTAQGYDSLGAHIETVYPCMAADIPEGHTDTYFALSSLSALDMIAESVKAGYGYD